MSLTHTKDQEAIPLGTEENRTQDEETVPCALCGKRYTPEELLCFEERWICARCKPVYFQTLQEDMGLTQHLHYAGFWIRAVAIIIDSVILHFMSLAMNIVFVFLIQAPLIASMGRTAEVLFLQGLIGFSLQMLLPISYSCFFLRNFAATPGKMLLGIQVLCSNGAYLSYTHALARFFAKFLSTILFGVGYLMAAFDVEKRALHDRLCDTRVVYKKKSE